MKDPDRFRHDRSVYERPNVPYVCGRAAVWGRPCASGPNVDGTCGGTSECTPFLHDGRYHCRRSKAAGGPCPDGPLPDGSCSQSQPPCVPRPSLRSRRWRLSLLTFAAVIALAAVLAWVPLNGAVELSSLNPGPLSAAHAAFALRAGCGSCHEAHGTGAAGWLAAVFAPQDMSKRCTACHAFSGPAESPHNAVFKDRSDLASVSCTGCHTEHKGAAFDIARLSDAQCSTCHRTGFASFSTGHPTFGPRYPHRSRTALRFDHVSHMDKHFQDARFADRAPTGCVSCHEVDLAGRDVRPASFEKTCAACHLDQIPSRDLLVLQWPELPEKSLAVLKERRADILEVCGVPADDDGADDDAYAESISIDEPTRTSAYLLDVDGEDPEAYGELFVGMVLEMAEEGAAPFGGRLAARTGKARAAGLLAGLGPELAKRVACAWAVNTEYEAPAEPDFFGWHADGVALAFRPRGHADPVVRAWLDLAAAGAAEEKDGARAGPMREELLVAEDGPGHCLKCHSVTETGAASGGAKAGAPTLRIEWTYMGSDSGPYTKYAHGPHIDLLGPDATCTNCHALDRKADFALSFKTWKVQTFASNFKPIGVETCASCHGAKKVREDCQLCHVYHLDHAFKERMK